MPPFFKVPAIRSKEHLTFVRSHECLLECDGERCNGKPVVAHHFTFIEDESQYRMIRWPVMDLAKPLDLRKPVMPCAGQALMSYLNFILFGH